MLRIGQRQYELVRAQSGIWVELIEPAEANRTQQWDLDAHYVPVETNPPWENSKWEYLRLRIHPFGYSVADWRNLTGFGLDTDRDDWIGLASLENLLTFDISDEVYDIIPGELELRPAGEYLFHCRFEGILCRGGGEEENLEFEDDIPFTEINVGVPINAADPLAVALARARRAVGLSEMDGGHVTRHNWRVIEKKAGPLEDHHQVYLRTPWRHHLA